MATIGGNGSRAPGKREPTLIASVDKALTILDLLTAQGPEMSVTDISRRAGLTFSTAHHIVSTLTSHGYLQQNPLNRRYRLGIRALALGIAAREAVSLVGAAQPVIEELAGTVNEHVNLAAVDGNATVYVSQVMSSRTIAIFMRLGTRVPMYCTGVGKAVLAFLPEEQAMQLAAPGGYLPYTVMTARDWPQLLDDLRAIRARGYAVDREEREEGVACVAAPIFDHTGQPCAALSISGPSTRITARIPELGKAALEAAATISSYLGHVTSA